jgi:hypothetical protein
MAVAQVSASPPFDVGIPATDVIEGTEIPLMSAGDPHGQLDTSLFTETTP